MEGWENIKHLVCKHHCNKRKLEPHAVVLAALPALQCHVDCRHHRHCSRTTAGVQQDWVSRHCHLSRWRCFGFFSVLLSTCNADGWFAGLPKYIYIPRGIYIYIYIGKPHPKRYGQNRLRDQPTNRLLSTISSPPMHFMLTCTPNSMLADVILFLGGGGGAGPTQRRAT